MIGKLRLEVLALAAAGATIMAMPSGASAAACVYDSATRTIDATLAPGEAASLAVTGDSLTFGGLPCLGATTTTTDSISIVGHVGTSERLVLDQRGGVFGPGATPESNVPEIEISANLGDEHDAVVVFGTDGHDQTAAGENGLALFGDGDVDVIVTPTVFRLEFHLLGGDDFFNGRGTFGAGLAFKGPIVATGADGNDLLRGSNNDDELDGGEGDDDLDGVYGRDRLLARGGADDVLGGSGDDSIDLGAGADTVIAGSGSDTVVAKDGAVDASLEGGAGVDAIEYDCGGLDPAPVGFETLTCGGGSEPPPPPPAGDCAFDAVARTLTAHVAAGGSGTLGVASGAITFDNGAPQDCGGATVDNVDTVRVIGAAGTVETVTLDQSGGAFAPGATAETMAGAASELEIALLLGDTTDVVTVVGTSGNDTLAVGVKGVALNGDSDADVTFDALPGALTLRGNGGVNSLGGRGGFGTGAAYAGALSMYAGDFGDTILGGLGNDALVGGAGSDTLEGREGNDSLDGGAGSDSVSGQAGNDVVTGGAGADSLSGSDGDDVLHANDGEADTNINGGPGGDTAYYDAALDTAVVAVENRFAS